MSLFAQNPLAAQLSTADNTANGGKMTLRVKSMCSWVRLPWHEQLIDSSLHNEPLRLWKPTAECVSRLITRSRAFSRRHATNSRLQKWVHDLCSLQKVAPVSTLVFDHEKHFALQCNRFKLWVVKRGTSLSLLLHYLILRLIVMYYFLETSSLDRNRLIIQFEVKVWPVNTEISCYCIWEHPNQPVISYWRFLNSWNMFLGFTVHSKTWESTTSCFLSQKTFTRLTFYE